MLKRLRIHNLAILENIDVSFSDGFTVLTGGTGAGKSLVIDSLSLLLGERASSEFIRQGEEKATIIGDFTLDSSRLKALLLKRDIPCPGDELSIERVISKTKSTIKANGVVITLADLNRIAPILADIHSQFDFAKILNPENYLQIIDGFSFENTSVLKEDYGLLLAAYLAAKANYESLLKQKEKIEQDRDFYAFQCKELQDANLRLGEEEEIEEEVALLKNYDCIYTLFEQAEGIIREDFIDKLYDLHKILDKLSSYQNKYEQTSKMLEDRYFELDETFRDLKKDFKSMDYDPERLNALLQRQADLSSLKRKYRKDITELILYRDELSHALDSNASLDNEIEAAKEECAKTLHACYEKGKELSYLRRNLAVKIEHELVKSLKDLLIDAEFRIEFAPNEEENPALLTPTGIDSVDFRIQTNVGEGLKSLAKTVSGGEASRIMLAFKCLFVQANKISTVVFDEIDSGLSGDAAMAVGRKIKELSLLAQVIAITHMPQVAASSDHAIRVEKKVEGGRTFTSIHPLSLEEKIQEVAFLISGGAITEKQIAYAKEIVLGEKK